VGLTILDTAEVITQCTQYDALFSFFENGVRDVVRLAVLNAGVTRRKKQELEGIDLDVFWMNSLAGQVIREWEHALDRALDYNHENTLMYSRDQLSADRRALLTVTVEIEQMVERLLEQILETHHFKIVPVEDQNDWLFGDDLLVHVNYGMEY
jgi:hypothetical protein